MANYIKSSRKEYVCSCCKGRIRKGDSYYRNGDKVYCCTCGPAGASKNIGKIKNKSKSKSTVTNDFKPQYSAKTYKVCGIAFKILAVVVMIVLGLPGFFMLPLLFVALLIAFGCWKLGNTYIKIAKSMTKPKEEIQEVSVPTVDIVEEKVTDPSKIIVFDVETTGLDYIDDEILQLSIIDGNYNVLFNEYFKPVLHEEWTNSEKVHGISPAMVLDKKPLSDFSDEIKKIFDNAEHLIGYNLEFDLDFIINSVIGIGYCDIDDKKQTDVMIDFAEIYGEYNPKYGDYKWQKLITCANYYGYTAEGSFHDSLEDVKATLYCYYKMNNI